MISKDDIRKLADLARIEVKEEELEKLAQDVSPVLDYVGQVNGVAGEMGDGVQIGDVFNVLREDANPNETGANTDSLLAEAPAVQNGFVKVKKIL